MRSLYLSVLVFVSGAAVLAVEILGTRVLGPFYGVSLFLWSALITVTLVALSVGYALGGRWADRGPRMARLCYLLVGAGAWLLILPFLSTPVLRLSEPGGLRFAVLMAAFLLFAPPLTLLGMVSPYAIRLRASSLGEVGRTAGDLYALSTIGSVTAALLTGFFLIPYVGVTRLMILVGVTLLIVALMGFLAARKMSSVCVTGGIVVLALFGLGAVTDEPDPGRGLVAVEQSPYAELRVVDVDDIRYMLIDGSIHTMVDIRTHESHFPYVHVLDVLNHIVADPGDLLLIGLGGGSVVKLFARKGWKIDAVEIDPAVTRIARRDFGVQDSEATVFHEDGRHFLAANPKTYDVIVIDAFGSSSVPFHLVTRESFALAKNRLEPGGILAVNAVAAGWRDLLVRSLTATLEKEFPEVLALPIAEPPSTLGNVILLASGRGLELVKEIPPTLDRFSHVYHKNHAWDNRFAPDTEGAPVLTDDLNPVDIWSERINRALRRGLHDHFADGVSW